MAQRMGRFWTAHEIRAFLQVLISNHFGPVLFVAGARRNEHAFVQASEQMELQNYFRTSRQCRSKFKRLRQLFNRAMLDFGPDPREENKSPFWDELRLLWDQSNQPHPGHAFPAGAGPAQNVGLRQMARIRLEPGLNAGPRNQGQREDGEEEEQEEIAPGRDVMEMPVTRNELEEVIALVQELSQRVAALEEQVQGILRQLNRRPRRR